MTKVNKNNLLLTLLALLLAAISAALIFMVAPKRAAKADGFSNEAPSFNNIAHVGGTYYISETNGVNVKFENETTELVYSKEIDITSFNGNQEFIKFYVKPLGDRLISFFVDIVDSENPDNILSVQINSKSVGGYTHDSSILACVPSIGQLYTGYIFENPNGVRANSVSSGHRKYSNITISDEINRTAYCSVHFGFDNSTNKIYTTIGDNPYNSTNNKLVCELSDTDRVITDYYLHDGTVDDKAQRISNKKGTFDVAWDGFEGSTITVKMRVVSRSANEDAALTPRNPVEIYIATIGNAPVDIKNLSFSTLSETPPTEPEPEEPTVLPVLSAEEGAEKLSAPQEGQMLKGKYLLIAADVADVHFIQGVLTKGENVYAFSWYVDGTAGDKNIEYTTITYNGAEYEYLLFDDNAGYEAFTYQTHNNGNKTIYVSSTALLFERYGQTTEEPSTETHNGYRTPVSSETMSTDTFIKVISAIALFAFVGILFSLPSFGRKTKIKKK